MNELLKALAPAKRRLRLQRLLQGAGAGFASGALAALILLAVTSFVPLDGRWLIAGAAAAGCTLLGALGNAARPVDAREAAGLAAEEALVRQLAPDTDFRLLALQVDRWENAPITNTYRVHGSEPLMMDR